MPDMTFDLGSVISILGYAVGAAVLYFGLRARVDKLGAGLLAKKSKVECSDDHGKLVTEVRVGFANAAGERRVINTNLKGIAERGVKIANPHPADHEDFPDETD